MKHRKNRSGAALLLVGVLIIAFTFSFVSCRRNGGVPDGAYSCIEADTGEMYTFSGREVRVTLFIMGNAVENHVGTYKVKDGMIEMEFPTDKDGIYTGTYSFSMAEDGSSITIADTEFTREGGKETTTAK